MVVFFFFLPPLVFLSPYLVGEEEGCYPFELQDFAREGNLTSVKNG